MNTVVSGEYAHFAGEKTYGENIVALEILNNIFPMRFFTCKVRIFTWYDCSFNSHSFREFAISYNSMYLYWHGLLQDAIGFEMLGWMYHEA